ncbi:AAA family ATPase [Nocardia fluminea]|uniref:nSTAND1 domain-containing NTPase n=1 Tax=Nocardia fluminea TaxID=134984 RepID=UPI0036703AF6
MRLLLIALGVSDEEQLRWWREALERVRDTVPFPAPPFPGMVPFKEDQAETFYGRRELLDKLSNAVDKEFAGTGFATRVVIVFGVSGAGKSSLLRAGLHVKRPHASLITPENQPLVRLETALRDLESAPEGEQLLIIDQCEELWTQQRGDQDEEGRQRREDFLRALSKWLRGGDRVAVIGLPAAYLGNAIADALFPGGERSRQIHVAPMTRAELNEAIRGPVKHTPGIGIEDALVETLLDQLDADAEKSEQGALPQLALALRQTWEAMERRNGSRALTVEDYLSTGRIQGAIAHEADSIYQDLTASQRLAAHRIMLCAVVVTPDSQTRDRIQTEKLKWDDIDDNDVEVVVERYLDARLLTADSSGYQISHEALLRAWPLLRGWIDADRESLQRARRLREEANNWDTHDRGDSYLLSRGRTEENESWRAARPSVEIGSTERQYLAASRHHFTKKARRRKVRVSALIFLLVVALVAAVVAYIKAIEATDARDEGLSRQAALQWELQNDRDTALAQAIALAGYRVAATRESRSALLDSTAVPVPRRSPTVGGPISTALSDDGALLAVCNSDGRVRLFRADTPGHPPIADFPVPAGNLYTVAFRPGTRELAVGGRNGAQVWDVSNPSDPRQSLVLPGVEGKKVENLAWSPEGTELAAAAAAAGTFRWAVTPDGKTATITARLPPAEKQVAIAVAYSTDGALLATSGADNTVELWDRRSNRATPLSRVPLNSSKALDLAFDPSSTKLAVGTYGNEALIADVSEPARPVITQRASGFESLVNAVAFGPGGTTLAAGSGDNTIRIFDTSTPGDRPAVHVLPGRAIVTSLQFRGTDLVSAAQDGFIRTWPLPGPVSASPGARIRTLTGNSDGTIVVAGLLGDPGDPAGLRQYNVTAEGLLTERGAALTFDGSDRPSGASTISPDGRLAAAGTTSGSVYLWDISEPPASLPPTVLPAVTSTGPAAMVFTPDSRYLFVGSTGESKQISVIDRSNPAKPAVVKTFQAGNLIQLLSVSADGRYLVAGTAGGIQLWKIADRPHDPENLATHPGFGANTAAVRFAGNDLLAAGNEVGAVQLYRVDDTGLHDLVNLDGPTGQIQALATDPDSARLAAGTADGQIWVWDITNPAAPSSISALSAHGDSVNDIVYGPRGHHLTAAGDAEVLQVWLADADAVAQDLCRFPAAQLTREEWNRYLPGTAYRPPCHQ